MLTEKQDAYGRAMLDHLEGRPAWEIVERDDGFFHPGAGPERYFAQEVDWPSHERGAIAAARGRVLDVGCGAGRVILHLQEHGMAVSGFDVSPNAVDVCRRRGAKDVEIRSITSIHPSMGSFDTIVMFGSNFGLFGSPSRARRLLGRMFRMTSDDARVIASTRDPAGSDDDAEIAYMRRNRDRDRMPGQWRIRIRYRDLCTPWFDYLTVTRDELAAIVDGTGWAVDRDFEGPEGRYAVVLRKVI
jgi:SAM-dependent methyltransferase